VRVNGVDVLAKLAAWGGIDLLNTLEATTLDESLLCFGVLRQHLGKLGSDVSEDIVGSED